MKFISRQRLKNSLVRLLHLDNTPELETELLPEIPHVALNWPDQEIERMAQISNAIPLQDPWMREWSRSAPDDVLNLHRDIWRARSLGTETPEFLQWRAKETELAAHFCNEPVNQKNIVWADFSLLGEKPGLYYKAANQVHYRLPDALQGAFPAIIAPSLSGAAATSLNSPLP